MGFYERLSTVALCDIVWRKKYDVSRMHHLSVLICLKKSYWLSKPAYNIKSCVKVFISVYWEKSINIGERFGIVFTENYMAYFQRIWSVYQTVSIWKCGTVCPCSCVIIIPQLMSRCLRVAFSVAYGCIWANCEQANSYKYLQKIFNTAYVLCKGCHIYITRLMLRQK